MANAFLVKAQNADREIVNSTQKWRGDTARSFLGEDITIQYVRLIDNKKGTLWLACDEDGLLKMLPLNFFLGGTSAEECIKAVLRNIPPAQAIVGDVVFVRTKPCDPTLEEVWDYEVEDLTEEDLAYINKLLNTTTQRRLWYYYKREVERGCGDFN